MFRLLIMTIRLYTNP